jgi:hypothetical protein
MVVGVVLNEKPANPSWRVPLVVPETMRRTVPPFGYLAGRLCESELLGEKPARSQQYRVAPYSLMLECPPNTLGLCNYLGSQHHVITLACSLRCPRKAVVSSPPCVSHPFLSVLHIFWYLSPGAPPGRSLLKWLGAPRVSCPGASRLANRGLSLPELVL